jgi:glutathione synthase/RimK-type ligase-like ATP-grasp enzyme
VLLLVTNREDLTADWLVLELDRRGTTFERFNGEDYPTEVWLRWAPDRASLRFGGRDLARADIRSVWWRRPLPPQMPPDLPGPEADWATGEALAALEGFWRTLDAHWVNTPARNAEADSKPEQLRRARGLGFTVPDTIVTNDPGAARAFLVGHPNAVCKSLRTAHVPSGSGEGVFYTSLVSIEDLADAAAFGPEPYLFQSLVDKDYDVRVTVIGDTAYSCRIESQDSPEARLDWRRGAIEQLPHAVEELPSDIASRCVALTHSYGLRFSAIDLARRPDGGFTFFELNPNGQWAWVERLTALPLAARLVDELLTGSK